MWSFGDDGVLMEHWNYNEALERERERDDGGEEEEKCKPFFFDIQQQLFCLLPRRIITGSSLNENASTTNLKVKLSVSSWEKKLSWKTENAKNKIDRSLSTRRVLVSDSHDPVGVLMWFLTKSHKVINKK